MQENKPAVTDFHCLDTLETLILKRFENGFVLDDDARHFLESSYSIVSAEDLPILMDECFENERETVLDLVVAPDHDFLYRIESKLGGYSLTPDEKEELTQKLLCAGPFVRLSFSGDDRTIGCALPPDHIRRFVTKLRITETIPSKIYQTMMEILTDKDRTSVAVLIRHAGMLWTDERETFVCRFLAYGRPDESRFQNDLDFALHHLAATGSDRSIEDHFIKTLQNEEKRLGEIETIYDMLTKNTMETLMLQGVRVPSQSPETLRSRIESLKHILASVFGWLDIPGPPPASVDIGDCVGETGVRKISALFS